MKKQSFKKRHLVFIFTFIVALPLFSQVFPGIEQKPKWWVAGWDANLGSDGQELWLDSLPVVFDEEEWTPVIAARYWHPENIPFPFFTPDTSILCYYRVEGLRVFIQNPGTTFSFAQGLLYDFSLNKGDSVYVLAPWDFPSDSILYHVEEVDTIYCGELGKRRLKVNFHLNEPDAEEIYYSTYWVEGIGDIYYPFLPLTCMFANCELGGFQTQLILEGDSLMTFTEQCITTAYDNIMPETNFSLFPNPVKVGADVTIDVPDAEHSKTLTLKVFDVVGHLVMEQRIGAAGSPLSFSTSGLPPGLFWVSLSNGVQSIHTQAMVVLEE